MNAKLATKLNLLNYIKSFSMPDFPDLKIFSKTFFNDLFLKLYKNDSQYTLLYGDIDGLRKLNDDIGFDKADLAIEELLKTVLNYLPENVISSRVGGDEFCFIIPDLSANETRKLTKQIHESLSLNKKVKGLDITFGACDSTDFNNINDMYTFVENKVNMKKHSHLKFNEEVKYIDDYNKKLDEFIDSTIKTYIKNFRFSSKRYFKPEDLKILSYPIINTITNLLHDDFVNDDINVQSALHDDILQIDSDVTTKIYNLIMSNNINFEDLDTISIEDLRCVRNNLSTDSITGAFNNVYRDHSGGGTFEIIVQNDDYCIITPDIIDNTLNKINLDENNLQLFGIIQDCPDASDYNSIYSKLHKICEIKKNKIKENNNYFISPEALKLIDVSLSSVVNFFKVQSKHLVIYNEHAKKEFSQKILNSLIDNFHELNLSNNL